MSDSGGGLDIQHINNPWLDYSMAYYFIEDDETQVWSAKYGKLVPRDDPEYLAWLKQTGATLWLSKENLKHMQAAAAPGHQK